MEHFNWYPGHMKKATDQIRKSLKLVDLVAEVIDARIPLSSRNPVIDTLLEKTPHLLLLNKKDLADPRESDRWEEFYRSLGMEVLKIDSLHGNITRDIEEASRHLLQDVFHKRQEKNIENTKMRMMIVGIPNVGKSTLINRIANRRVTQVGNRPGVTKQNQWIKTKGDFELLDTPGILWPKFEDKKTGLHLALLGSIKDEIMDVQDLAFELIKILQKSYPQVILNRYGVDPEGKGTLEIMDEIALKRGAILRGHEVDYQRVSSMLLDEFRKGALGRITLETVDHV